MFSLLEKVFVWLVLAVSAVQARLPWLPGHRDSVLAIEEVPYKNRVLWEDWVVTGFGQEVSLPFFPHWSSPFFPHLILGLAETLLYVPLSPVFHLQQKQHSSLFPSGVSSLLGKGPQLQKKGGEGKENKWCRAGTEKWSQTLVRRVPGPGVGCCGCNRAELSPVLALHVSPSSHGAVGCTGLK